VGGFTLFSTNFRMVPPWVRSWHVLHDTLSSEDNLVLKKISFPTVTFLMLSLIDAGIGIIGSP
jgi:hypothetical protein